MGRGEAQARQRRLEREARERLELDNLKPAPPKVPETLRAKPAPEVTVRPRSAVVRRTPTTPPPAKPTELPTVRQQALVGNWSQAAKPARILAEEGTYRTTRTVPIGETLTFSADKTASGNAERYTVLSTRTMGGRADAVTEVKLLHQRIGRDPVEITKTMGDWQRFRDRHARAYGYQ